MFFITYKKIYIYNFYMNKEFDVNKFNILFDETNKNKTKIIQKKILDFWINEHILNFINLFSSIISNLIYPNNILINITKENNALYLMIFWIFLYILISLL